MNPPDLVSAVVPVLKAFDRMTIPYYVGGSLASSAHGIPRASVDADVIAELAFDHVGPLVQELRNDYYIEGDSIRVAIKEHRSFNLIHLASMIKIDVFVPKDEPYDRSAFGRAMAGNVTLSLGTHQFVLATAEDTILNKLLWFRKGGEVSERQWSDVIGIFTVQGPSLDMSYMKEWADAIGVSDLLERAIEEAPELAP